MFILFLLEFIDFYLPNVEVSLSTLTITLFLNDPAVPPQYQCGRLGGANKVSIDHKGCDEEKNPEVGTVIHAFPLIASTGSQNGSTLALSHVKQQNTKVKFTLSE